MIKIEKVDVYGWEAAIRGMRNPMNSWDKSDSDCKTIIKDDGKYVDFIGENDLKLMKKLCAAGTDHRKFLRMITVTVDIVAPLYWWKEYDTYKVGTVANSCSTMHKIHAKEFTIWDFSCEHLLPSARRNLESTIDLLNEYRKEYNVDDKPEVKKTYWWQMIQLLPSSYNQRRTVQLNYEVLANMYHARKAHKLDEWRMFCGWIETLPLAEDLICGNR